MNSWVLGTSVRFATVGVLNTLLTIGVIFSLKAFAGAPDVAANASGYVVGLVCSFTLNKRWTFQHEDRLLPALARFVTVFGVAYLSNIVVVLALIGAGFNDYLAHLVGMPVYTAVFYLGCLQFAFRRSADRGLETRGKTVRTHIALPLLWCAILFALVALKLQPSWEPVRSNDSYQYLSAAENLQHGMVGKTSLVHYDEERSSGVVPSPMTTFPLGYPLLLGVLEATGLSGEQAALILSLLASLGSLFLLDLIGRQLSLSTTARHWVLAMFVASSWTLVLAISVLSEAVFTFAILCALALLMNEIADPHAKAPRTGMAIAAGLAFGLSYWLRYAGLFVILGLLPVAVLAWAMQRRGAVRPTLIAFCVASLIMAGGMVRNILLMGTWRGGNTKTVDNSALDIAHGFGIAIRDLLFGPPRMSEWLLLRGLLFLAIVAVGIAAAVAFKKYHGRLLAPLRNHFAAAVLATIVASYLTCLTYAAAHTGISYGARYFFPMLPIVLLLLALAISWIEIDVSTSPRRWRGVLVAVAGSYAALHLSLFYLTPLPTAHEHVAKRLETRISGDSTARQSILSLAGPSGVVMANVGQATGYVLRRPVISLIGTRLGSVEWNEVNVRNTMKRFAVSTLVVYKPGPDLAVVPYPSLFIERLAAGDAPEWLHRVGTSEAVVIYRPAAIP